VAEGISLRAYSRRRGCSLTAVQKAIAAGRIKKLSNGKIDPDAADAAWTENTNASLRRGPAAAEDVQTSFKSPRPAGPGLPPEATADMGKPTADTRSFAAARAVREAYAARRAKLQFEKESGKVVDVDEVRDRWSKTLLAIKTRILGIPSKVRSQHPDMPHTDVAIIDQICREMLEELANDVAS
jgi:hypothetical protein